MTATPEKDNIHFDGGVALGVSGLFIQTHYSLKCRPRHLRHPAGLPGWCRNRGSVNRRDPRMMLITMLDQHKLIMRRTTNLNAHIITPHGKVMAGRKGRKG